MLLSLQCLMLAAAPLLSSFKVTDDGCALDAQGHVRCIDLQDHCVAAPPSGEFRSIGTSEGTSGCGLRADGTVSCWGTFSAARVPADLARVEHLSVEKPHACALQKGGSVRCWGTNYQGSLAVPAGTFIAVDAGHSVSCGVRPDGTLSCWGWRAGDLLKPPAGKFKTVSVGLQAACAIGEAGALTCWGDLPKAPAGTFTSVSVGQFGACAIRPTGAAVCFGVSGEPKELGPKGSLFAEVGTRCGLLRDGGLVCWHPAHPEVLLADDGKTQVADATGACQPPRPTPRTGPLPQRRPWVDAAMQGIRAGMLDIESGRDHVRDEDLPHFAAEYRNLKSWREKAQLVNLVCDSLDPVLAEMMWDALDVPDCTYPSCKYPDGWEVRAIVLSYLDRDFQAFTKYLNDTELTTKTIARRLRERASRPAKSTGQ